MPIRDVAAMNASLDNDYGATRGPNAPASHELALYVGDPQVDPLEGGGYEIADDTCPGYARVSIPNNGVWAPANEGLKTLIDGAEFPPPTGEWADEPTHWGLVAPGGVVWDTGPFTEALQVTAASDTGPLVQPTVFYSDAVIEEEE